MADLKTEFLEIIFAWTKGDSYPDIYTMLVLWISKHKDEIKTQNEVQEILQRMVSDELKEIVEDVLVGMRYFNLRKEILIDR
jgi:DNA-binding HxlR family transcriptional regulator